MTRPTLSIIILSYNIKSMLRDCLASVEKVKTETDFEVIVPDNASTDGSADMVEKEFPWVKKVVRLTENKGFAGGNNAAKPYAKGEYVLFLNADTIVHKGTLKRSVAYLNNHSKVGALTCRMLLANGKLDKDTRRSFINPWIGLVHLFLKLDRLFPKSRLFGRYWYGYIPEDTEHEVDVIEGAYFFTRKKLLDEVGWFDESYFLDGENIELCWQIKSRGWKIMYVPKVSITHYKGAAKGKVKSQNRKAVPLSQRLKFRMAGVDSMEKFYRRHLWKKYPAILNWLVVLGIKTIKLQRCVRTVVLG